MYSNNKYKRKGFMMISAIMSMLIILMIAHGFMTMFGGQFTYLSAGKTAAQGQQFAELIGEKVKLEGIDAEPVTTKTSLETLTGNSKDKNWLYTYEISDGTTDENGNTFKVATIKVYKEGETSPRYTQEIPLSSLGNGDGLIVGAVIAWPSIVDPSTNYLECNGQAVDPVKYPKLYALMHNTPDYRGVFLRGFGSIVSSHYNKVTHSSAALGELQGDAIRNIAGTVHGAVEESRSYATGAFSLIKTLTPGSDAANMSWGFSFNASRVVPVAEENRPINKAVRYFIKAR